MIELSYDVQKVHYSKQKIILTTSATLQGLKVLQNIRDFGCDELLLTETIVSFFITNKAHMLHLLLSLFDQFEMHLWNTIV